MKLKTILAVLPFALLAGCLSAPFQPPAGVVSVTAYGE